MDEIEKERIEMGMDDPQDLIEDEDDELEDDEDSNEGDDDDLFDDDEEDDSEDDDEDDGDGADEDDDDESDRGRSRRGISPKKFARIRGREAAERRRRKEIEGELASAQSKLKEYEEAANAKPAISDEDIRAEAAAMVVFTGKETEEQKKQILQTAEAQLRRVINLVQKGQKPPKELSELQTTVAQLRDQQIFNEEWDSFSDDLPRHYPNATPRQLRMARRAMDRLSHAPKFADKEFDYVFFKNKDIFDQIFRKSRTHTFEQGSPVRGRNEGGENRRGSKTPARNLTPKELEKRHAQMEKEARAEDQRSGWNINNPDGSSVE